MIKQGNMKKNMRVLGKKIFVFSVILAMMFALTACKKNNADSDTESSITNSSTQEVNESVKEEAPAESESTELPANDDKTDSSVESEKEFIQPDGVESEQSESEVILENDGELEILVPEGEETFGE